MVFIKLSPPRGAVKRVKRVGRGQGSGHGKTATKGHKGQMARSGGHTRRGFEGGQMPLYRRMPKRGFTNPFRVEYDIVHLEDLSVFPAGSAVTPELIYEKKIVKKVNGKIKILKKGQLPHALNIKIHKLSSTAKADIEKAGGTVEVLK